MSSRYPTEFIQELLTRVDIVEVVQSHVPLKKYGREFRARCPFHTERTPSFYVSPIKQVYHCFGCGEGGNAVQFLMNYSNLQFFETIEELASIVGMEIPDSRTPIPGSVNAAELFEFLDKVQLAYRNELLKSEPDSEVKNYIKGRQISQEAALHFGLGFAPNQWDYLLKKFGRSSADRKLLRKVGLTIKKDQGHEYDRFRNRLMFPIYDRRGRAIAFGGRVFDSGEPKYVNSPETLLFKKSNELFGLHQALKTIRDSEQVIIVEGYTDVLTLFQFGFNNAVATLGTATTSNHIRKLFRLSQELVFCFDGDDAGRKAAWRAMESVLPEMRDGCLAGFVFLPERQDPDTFLREKGAEEFQNLISRCEPIGDFIFREILNRADINRADGKAKLVYEFTPIFKQLPDSTMREVMKEQVCELTGLSNQYIESRLAPVRRYYRSNKKVKFDQRDLTNRALTLLIQNPSFARLVDQPDNLIDYKRGQNSRLLVEVLSKLAAYPKLSTGSLIEEFRNTETYDLVCEFAVIDHHESSEKLGESFNGIISKIVSNAKRESVHREIKALFERNDSSQFDAIELIEQIKKNRKLESNLKN